MQKGVLRLAALIAVGLVVLVAMWIERDREPSGEASPRGLAAPQGGPAAEAPAEAQSPIETRDFEPAGRETLYLVRVSDQQARPVSGARVRWQVLSQFEADPARSVLAGPTLFEGTSDARGEVHLARWPGSAVRVSAQLGALGACLDVDAHPPTAPIALQLVAPREVLVRVRSMTGEPVSGMLVVLDRSPFEAHAAHRTLTDALGQATFSLGTHIPRWLAARELETVIISPSGERVVLPPAPIASQGPTEISAIIDAPHRVVVKVLDEAGQPAHGPMAISARRLLSATGMRQVTHPTDLRARTRSFDGPMTTIHGLMDAGPVEFRLSATGRADVVLEHRIPATPTTSSVELTLGPALADLGLSFVHPDGQPHAGLRIALEWSASGDARAGTPAIARPQRERAVLQTDASGRIAQALPPGLKLKLLVSYGRPEVSWIVDPNRLREPVGPPLFSLDLDPLQSGYTRELGPFKVSPPASIAAGTVLDEHGQPVAGASIALYNAQKASRRALERRLDAHGDSDFLTGLGRRTDEHGRFTIHGPMDHLPPLAITATFGTLASRLLPVQAGAQDLVLVLQPVGGLSGSARSTLGPEVPIDVLAIEDAPMLPYLERGGRSRRNIASDGRFELRGLPSGSCTVRFQAADEVLLDIPGIDVQAGALVADPRLQGLVLGLDHDAVEVRLQDERGAPIAKAMIRREQGQRPPLTQVRTNADGVARFARRRGEPLTIEVFAQGYNVARRVNPEFPLVITLRKETMVR